MPGLDKNGPEGQGSKTGRGLGIYNPEYEENSYANNVGLASGLRLGCGRNAGKFFGREKRWNKSWGF